MNSSIRSDMFIVSIFCHYCNFSLYNFYFPILLPEPHLMVLKETNKRNWITDEKAIFLKGNLNFFFRFLFFR